MRPGEGFTPDSGTERHGHIRTAQTSTLKILVGWHVHRLATGTMELQFGETSVGQSRYSLMCCICS